MKNALSHIRGAVTFVLITLALIVTLLAVIPVALLLALASFVSEKSDFDAIVNKLTFTVREFSDKVGPK